MRNKINHHVSEYFRRNLQISSTNVSDSNMSFPYKHRFFTGLDKLPFLSSEPKLINIPVSPVIIQGYYTASFEELDNININSFPKHNISFSMNSLQVKDNVRDEQIDLKEINSHIKAEDLSLIDENTINSYNKLISNTNKLRSPQKTHGISQKDDDATNNLILSHPNKPGVTAISILEVVPLNINPNSVFQIMLDSNDSSEETILELQEGWKYPTTRFSFYKKSEDKAYKYDRDYASNLPKENSQSYVISIPKHFIKKTRRNSYNEIEVSSAYIFATRAPKILLSKVSSIKKKPRIKLL